MENPSPPTAASRCPRTSSWLLSTFLPTSFPPKPPPFRLGHQQARRYGHAAAAANAADATTELLGIVDERDPGSVHEHLELCRDPYLRKYAQPDGPKLVISDKREDIFYPTSKEAARGDPKILELTEKMRLGIHTRKRTPVLAALEPIYKLYKHLPEPRMLHLPGTVRHRLLKAMGTPDRRNAESMLRYFSLIEDVKNAGLTLRRREWNLALAFASHCVRRTRQTDLEAALQLFNEGEKKDKPHANGITFNILFNAAAKAGNFSLAEKIYIQMESRGLQFNRYHRVSLIHFFGLKGDPDGIRAAYKEMVEAGEIIDNVVLNCLIASFLRADDEDAAIRVYNHMKGTEIVAPAMDDSPNLKKIMAEVHMMYARISRKHPDLNTSFQKQAISSPDLQTYRILISHYASTAGKLSKVVQHLDEMRWFNIPIHGSIFLAIFKGFARHGGRSASSWSEERLVDVFTSLMEALDCREDRLYINTWLVGWALRAFMVCAGPDAVLKVYGEFEKRWSLDDAQVTFMQEFLSEVLRGGGQHGDDS